MTDQLRMFSKVGCAVFLVSITLFGTPFCVSDSWLSVILPTLTKIHAAASVQVDADFDGDTDGVDLAVVAATYAANPLTETEFSDFTASFGTLIGPTPVRIKIEPSRSVVAGTEILFDGSDINNMDGNERAHSNFDWHFGDGFRSGLHGGMVITHTYPLPGNYSVTLTVTKPDGTAVKAQTTIRVTGKTPLLTPLINIPPILSLTFENTLADDSPSALSVSCPLGSAEYADGIEGRALSLIGGKYLTVADPQGILSNRPQFTLSFRAKKRTENANGYLFHRYETAVWSHVFQMRLDEEKGRFVRGYVGTDDSVQSATGYARNVDTAWHHYVLVYDGGRIIVYLDGLIVAEREQSGVLLFSSSPLFIGASNQGDRIFDGYIDDFRIYDQALTVEELFVGFELWHADFHGRIQQDIHAMIPSLFTTTPDNRLIVSLTSDNGNARTLFDTIDLTAKETFQLDHAILPAGQYQLTAQLLDPVGKVLASLSESFDKPYDGIPHVGIDKENALRIDGELFFFQL